MGWKSFLFEINDGVWKFNAHIYWIIKNTIKNKIRRTKRQKVNILQTNEYNSE